MVNLVLILCQFLRFQYRETCHIQVKYVLLNRVVEQLLFVEIHHVLIYSLKTKIILNKHFLLEIQKI